MSTAGANKKKATALKPNNPTEGFLDAIHPYTYRYKDPSLEPTNTPTGEPYLGIMAQDAEKAPTGDTLVKTNPENGLKYLETGPMLSALAASVAYLHHRLKNVEAGYGGHKT